MKARETPQQWNFLGMNLGTPLPPPPSPEGDEAPSYRQSSTTRVRARTSVPGSNHTSASRGDFPPPAPGCGRLRTVEATRLTKSSAYPRQQRKPPDAPPAIGGTSSEFPAVENVSVIEGEEEAQGRSSSTERRLGASAIDTESPEEAPMPEIKIGCVGRLEKGASLMRLSPRAGLSAIEFGADQAGRLRILATSCLVRCLQKQTTGAGAPGRREAVVDSDNRNDQSSSDDSNVSPTSGAAQGEERLDGNSRASSVASSARRHYKHLKASRKGITSTVVTRAYKRENKTRRRDHSMPKRTAPTRAGIDSDQRPLGTRSYGWCGNDAIVGIHHRGGMEGREVSASEGQEGRHHQSTKVFVELEQLGAVQRAPELLRAANPLLQELGVLLLLHGVEHAKKETLRSNTTRFFSVFSSGCPNWVKQTAGTIVIFLTTDAHAIVRAITLPEIFLFPAQLVRRTDRNYTPAFVPDSSNLLNSSRAMSSSRRSYIVISA